MNCMHWQNPEKQEYGYYNINLLGTCLTAILPIRGKQRAQVGQAACPSGASTLPMLGKHVAPSGHKYCPECAQNIHVMKPLERNAMTTWYDDTSVILLCKDNRKVSFTQAALFQIHKLESMAENDTLTLCAGKTIPCKQSTNSSKEKNTANVFKKNITYKIGFN